MMTNEVIISRDDSDAMFAALRAIGRHLAELAKTPGHEGTVYLVATNVAVVYERLLKANPMAASAARN